MQKIQPVRSMGDMEEGEAAVINQLQFDEMQKRMGKPTSKEMKVHEMLKQVQLRQSTTLKLTIFRAGTPKEVRSKVSRSTCRSSKSIQTPFKCRFLRDNHSHT